MAPFRSLTADRRPFDEFKTRARGMHGTAMALHLFEWAEAATHGEERGGIKSIEDLEAQSRGAVRVIFAPQDVPTAGHGERLLELFEAWGIPSAFVDESLQHVSQSFAAQEDEAGTTFVWFHFLCKTLAIVGNKIVHIRGPDDEETSEMELRNMAQGQSHANFSWVKPGFVLKIRKQNCTSGQPTRTSTSDSDDTLTSIPAPPIVELFCFGAPITFQSRFRTIIGMATCDDLVRDPYTLLEVAFEEMYKVLDWTSWNLSDIFGPTETQALDMASNPGKATKDLVKDHFTGLHNLAKHTIYLRENCEAALATLDELCSHHRAVIGDNPSLSQRSTRQSFKYRRSLFESTQRRLTSLNARISNIIQLSFNTVTQGDSKVMQSENQSMKTIAVMTLFFMPLGTVASIFGSQFMELKDERPHHITVSQDFWLMWVIAIPLTIIVLAIWRVWYKDARGRLVDGRQKRNEHNYLGWKTLFERLWESKKENLSRTIA